MYKRGFSSVNKQVNLGASSQTEIDKVYSRIQEVDDQFIYARVTDIILDDTHPSFQQYGGFISIGTIFFKSIEGEGNLIDENTIARPLLPYQKNYPLVNEFVALFKLPKREFESKASDSTIYYYLNAISIWNHPHLNAYPNVEFKSTTQRSERKTYSDIEGGQTRKPSGEEINYSYNSPLVGGTFIEKSNIHPLLAFAGDIITEGRWGNSIRFGSTAKTNSILYSNNWSNSGEDGNPITIIRNGQPKNASPEGYLPIIENINEDLSSIYLTSNQTIPLSSSILNNPAVNALPPQNIITYRGSQIILNSNRLVFNTKSNSIILNSKQSISLASVGPIGIYSKNNDVVLQSSRKNVRLGDSQASQSVIKGDNFLRDFEILLQKLQNLSEKLTGEPQLKLSTLAAGSLNETVTGLLNNIEGYKSKVVKTI